MSVFSSFFSRVTVPASVVDGVAIGSFTAPMAAVYAVSHIEGVDWEAKVLGPMIAAVRAQGPAVEAEAIAAATAAVNAELARIAGPLVAAVLESVIDGEISSLITSLFAVVLAAVGTETVSATDTTPSALSS